MCKLCSSNMLRSSKEIDQHFCVRLKSTLEDTKECATGVLPFDHCTGFLRVTLRFMDLVGWVRAKTIKKQCTGAAHTERTECTDSMQQPSTTNHPSTSRFLLLVVVPLLLAAMHLSLYSTI